VLTINTTINAPKKAVSMTPTTSTIAAYQSAPATIKTP